MPAWLDDLFKIITFILAFYGVMAAVAAKRSALAAEKQAQSAEEQAVAAAKQADAGAEQLELMRSQHMQQRRVAVNIAQRALADRVQICREIPRMLARHSAGISEDIADHPLQISMPEKSASIVALLETEALRQEWDDICTIESNAIVYVAKKQVPQRRFPDGLELPATDAECEALAREAADRLHAFQRRLQAGC